VRLCERVVTPLIIDASDVHEMVGLTAMLDPAIGLVVESASGNMICPSQPQCAVL
jgi:hypothetical protein